MFDVGFSELLLLGVVGLLVLGPERLPGLTRTLGAYLRKARTSWYTLKRSIESELAAAEVQQSLDAAKKDLESLSRNLNQAASDPISALAGIPPASPPASPPAPPPASDASSPEASPKPPV